MYHRRLLRGTKIFIFAFLAASLGELAAQSNRPFVPREFKESLVQVHHGHPQTLLWSRISLISAGTKRSFSVEAHSLIRL